MIRLIALHSSPATLLQCLPINKRWNQILSDDNFWQQKCAYDFPDHPLIGAETFRKRYFLTNLLGPYLRQSYSELQLIRQAVAEYVDSHQPCFAPSMNEQRDIRAELWGDDNEADEEAYDETRYQQQIWSIYITKYPLDFDDHYCVMTNRAGCDRAVVVGECMDSETLVKIIGTYYYYDRSYYLSLAVCEFITKETTQRRVSDIPDLYKYLEEIATSENCLFLSRDHFLPFGTSECYQDILDLEW